MALTNKFGGTCPHCKTWIPAGAGTVTKVPGTWQVRCLDFWKPKAQPVEKEVEETEDSPCTGCEHCDGEGGSSKLDCYRRGGGY